MFHFSGYQQFLPSPCSSKTPNLKPAFDAKELETVDMEAITDVQFSSTDRLVTCDRPVSLNYPGPSGRPLERSPTFIPVSTHCRPE